MNENEEEKKKKKGAVDYANQAYNKGSDAYNAYKKVQGAVRAVRGAGAAAEGAETAVGAASTIEVWGPIAILALIILLIIIVIIIIFGGGAAGEIPTCETITSDSVSTTPGTPITITLNNCSANAIFSWSSSVDGGTFTPPDGQTTSYNAPTLPTYPAILTITANVCSNIAPTQCNQYAIDVSIGPPTCESLGGSCVSAQLCRAEGSGTITGATDCSTNVCCNFSSFTCPSGNYAACLKAQFGITAVNMSNAMLKEIYTTYASAFDGHTNYLALFKSRASTYTFVPAAGPNGAFAIAHSGGDVTLYQGFANTSNSFQKFVLIHESGHVIAGARPSLQINLYNQTYNAGVDLACFSNLGILKTYPAGVVSGGVTMSVRINETFAESLADTLTCTGSGTCKGNGGGASPISNFPSTCAYIVNYIKTKVL